MNLEVGIAEEAVDFPGLMPTELLVMGFLDQVKLLIVLEFALINMKLKISVNSKYGPIYI